MAMQLHELHPTLIHAPLGLLPAAAFTDLAAASLDWGARRLALDAAGRRLWWGGVGGALVAGLAGMAASQEIRLDDPAARDAMWLHGMGNLGILLASAGVAAWRSTHRANALSAALGAGAVGALIYTAWLGGELVYAHGAGVKGLPAGARAGVEDSPPLLSASAPWRFLRDATKGMAWLLGRGARLAARKEPLAPAAAKAGEPVSAAAVGFHELRT
jgi:uncharacterized membrane protein